MGQRRNMGLTSSGSSCVNTNSMVTSQSSRFAQLAKPTTSRMKSGFQNPSLSSQGLSQVSWKVDVQWESETVVYFCQLYCIFSSILKIARIGHHPFLWDLGHLMVTINLCVWEMYVMCVCVGRVFVGVQCVCIHDRGLWVHACVVKKQTRPTVDVHDCIE